MRSINNATQISNVTCHVDLTYISVRFDPDSLRACQELFVSIGTEFPLLNVTTNCGGLLAS